MFKWPIYVLVVILFYHFLNSVHYFRISDRGLDGSKGFNKTGELSLCCVASTGNIINCLKKHLKQAMITPSSSTYKKNTLNTQNKK